MTAYGITEVVAADHPVIAGVHGQCFEDAWSAAMIRQILAMQGAFGLVARSEEDELLGFALSRTAGDECELLSLAVADGSRRHGIGRALLVSSMRLAAARGCQRFFLEVAEDNGPALTLYRSHGMVAVGRRPGYYQHAGGGATAALTMRCDLSAQRLDEVGDSLHRESPERF